MASPESIIANLRASANTGQCSNPFFRQSRLKALHDVLRINAVAIQNAVQKDTDETKSEATIEVAAALSVIKEHYDSIDPKKALESEKQISKGYNAEDQREPYGVVYIEPQSRHTPFFAIVAPVSAAVAAGNVIALKLEMNTRELSLLLRSILPQALTTDIFAIVSESPSIEALRRCLQVQPDPQEPGMRLLPTHPRLLASHKPVIAIVDRTADLSHAAKSLVTARFAFCGTSPYAPDTVLVNEFVVKMFLDHVLRALIPYTTRSSSNFTEGMSNDVSRISRDKMEESLNRLRAGPDWSASTISKSDGGAVVELINKSGRNKCLPGPITAPIFAVSIITSSDHAIDLVSKSGRLSASYYFAEPTTASYLNHFIASDVAFINHIPVPLLLGPAAPLSSPFNLEKRYTVEHFSKVAPVFSAPPMDHKELLRALGGDNKTAQAMTKAALQEIKPVRRPEWIAKGFFEQGIFIGLVVYGVPVLSCIGASLFYGVRFGLRKWAM